MKKYFFLIVICLVIFSMFAMASAEGLVPAYVLTSDSPSDGLSNVVLSLTNNSDEEITVKGPIEVQVTLDGDFYDVEFPREALDTNEGDVILSGQESITIAAGATAEIAEIAPGLANSWRPFETADHDMLINAWVKINSDTEYWRSEIVTHTVEPVVGPEYDLTLSTIPTVWNPDGPAESVILKLTNNTGAAVTITGPVVATSGEWNSPGARETFSLIGAAASITVAPGETKDVVEFEPGPPMGWRNFYFPKLFHFEAWIPVEGSAGSVLLFDQVEHGILGSIIDEGYGGSIQSITENDDGTAAIVVIVNHTTDTNIVTYENDEYSQIQDHIVGDPAEGFIRRNFWGIQQGPQGEETEIGTIVSATETVPGVYTLIWSHVDGVHENIFIQASPDPEGPFVAYLMGPNWAVYTIELATQNRPVETELNETSGKYEGTLEYPSATITFSSDSEIDAAINLTRKGTSSNPAPEGTDSAGIYFEINLASGELGDVEILLEISYTLNDIPAGMQESNLKLYRYNTDTEEWDLLPNQETDTENKVIRVWLSGFSEFGVFEQTESEDPADPEDPAELPQTGTDGIWPLIPALFAVLSGVLLKSAKKIR